MKYREAIAKTKTRRKNVSMGEKVEMEKENVDEKWKNCVWGRKLRWSRKLYMKN